MAENRFEGRYREGNTPWDHDMVDYNLIEAIERHGVQPCRALDIGCGTGENAIWLAKQGFDVVACDFAETAIEKAKIKSEKASADICFIVADFLTDPVPDAPFGFVVDRGCLHCMSDDNERNAFIKKVSELLGKEGCWLSLIGNADEPKREVGPPQLTATEVASSVEPYFEILSLTSGHFGSDQEVPPRAWVCFMRKRAF